MTAQLVGITGAHKSPSLWAETFDVELSEIFNVQDRISESVAEAFKIHLSTEERQLIAKRYTSDPEVFDLVRLVRAWSVFLEQEKRKYRDSESD